MGCHSLRRLLFRPVHRSRGSHPAHRGLWPVRSRAGTPGSPGNALPATPSSSEQWGSAGVCGALRGQKGAGLSPRWVPTTRVRSPSWPLPIDSSLAPRVTVPAGRRQVFDTCSHLRAHPDLLESRPGEGFRPPEPERPLATGKLVQPGHAMQARKDPSDAAAPADTTPPKQKKHPRGPASWHNRVYAAEPGAALFCDSRRSRWPRNGTRVTPGRSTVKAVPLSSLNHATGFLFGRSSYQNSLSGREIMLGLGSGTTLLAVFSHRTFQSLECHVSSWEETKAMVHLGGPGLNQSQIQMQCHLGTLFPQRKNLSHPWGLSAVLAMGCGDHVELGVPEPSDGVCTPESGPSARPPPGK